MVVMADVAMVRCLLRTTGQAFHFPGLLELTDPDLLAIPFARVGHPVLPALCMRQTGGCSEGFG